MIDRLRTMVSGAKPSIHAVLDIGTVEAKALIVLVEGDRAGIVGVGRRGHEPGAIVNGSLADARSQPAPVNRRWRRPRPRRR